LLCRLLFAVGLALTAWVNYAETPVQTVVLSDEAGKAQYMFPLKPGERFTVRFLHSWARSPVEEVFVVEDGILKLKETVYEDFGAGLPHEPEHSGSLMVVENGKIYVRDIDRPVPNLQIRVGRLVANHELIHPSPNAKIEKNKTIPFSRFAQPGSVVVFDVRPMERYALWTLKKQEVE
jgi:hypothetical protein